MTVKKEAAIPISVKLRSSDVKAKVSSALKELAAAKGVTQGEALEFIVDTVRTYGELPAVTTQALNGFTTTVEGRLNDIEMQLVRLLNVLGIPDSDVNVQGEYEAVDDGFDGIEEMPVMAARPVQVKRGFRPGKRSAV